MEYPLGQNRLIYQAPNFLTGLSISVVMWSPALVKSTPVILIELEEGFYYFDINFTEVGPWIGLFSENNKKVLSCVFRVGIESGIVRYVK